jgi:DtxR family Mn-dependent transcriptional regulator
MSCPPALEDLSLAQQRYVEVIGGLIRDKGRARTTDVAEALQVSLPSVSEAVKRLVRQGIAVRAGRFEIGLSEEGSRIAGQLESRHGALRRFMVDVMAMKKERADEVACRVEHCVDGDFAERLRKLAEFLEREYPETLQGIADYVRKGRRKAAVARTA